MHDQGAGVLRMRWNGLGPMWQGLECPSLQLLLRVSEIAAQREAQCGADIVHAQGTQLGYAPAQSMLGDSDYIVQVHRACSFHAIFRMQDNFGWHATDRGRNGCDSQGGEIGNGAVTCENDHRPVLIGWGKAVEANIPAGYFVGHSASASQALNSSRCFGSLE